MAYWIEFLERRTSNFTALWGSFVILFMYCSIKETEMFYQSTTVLRGQRCAITSPRYHFPPSYRLTLKDLSLLYCHTVRGYHQIQVTLRKMLSSQIFCRLLCHHFWGLRWGVKPLEMWPFSSFFFFFQGKKIVYWSGKALCGPGISVWINSEMVQHYSLSNLRARECIPQRWYTFGTFWGETASMKNSKIHKQNYILLNISFSWRCGPYLHRTALWIK